MFLLCFSSLPFRAWYDLGTKDAGIHRPPRYIVVLGGVGMPSESGLIRTLYAAKIANRFQNARVIVALPGKRTDSLSSANLMIQELIHRGIQADRIISENTGTNTRAQALRIFDLIRTLDPGKSFPKPNENIFKIAHAVNPRGNREQVCLSSLVIVTSPEHLFRAVRSFKKAGFAFADGFPAFDNAIESDITFIDKELGGRKWLPDMGKNLTIRYRFWSQMSYEQLVLREYFALAYYWVQGWI